MEGGGGGEAGQAGGDAGAGPGSGSGAEVAAAGPGGEDGGRLAELAAVAGREDLGPEQDAAFIHAAREALQGSQSGSFSGRSVAVARGVVARELRGGPGGAGRAVAFLQGLLPAHPGPETFTLMPLHSDFVRCCLLARLHLEALSLLELEGVILPDRRTAGPTAQDFMLYHYYGGVVFLGLRRYADAQRFFAIVLTAPAQAESAITEAAWKKYLATALLLHVPAASLPKHCSKAVQRQIKKCKEYEEFRAAFESGNSKQLQDVLAQHRARWVSDGNLGLLKLCVEAQVRFQVRRLASAYVNLRLDVLAQKLGLQGAALAEQLLVKMVSAGQISARIDQARGVVTFDAEEAAAPDALEALRGGLAHASALNEKVRAFNESLDLDKKFVSKHLSLASSEARTGDLFSEAHRKGMEYLGRDVGL